MLRFYMQGRWAKPHFGTNRPAAGVWTAGVFAVGVLVGLIATVIFRQDSLAVFSVLGGALIVLLLMIRFLLPEALRLYEVDRVIARHAEERRASTESWMRADWRP